jgi:hypothetical protein
MGAQDLAVVGLVGSGLGAALAPTHAFSGRRCC